MTVIEDVQRNADNSDLLEGLAIIDVDSHWSEQHDLWTSRAPDKYKDLVPQVAEVDGKRRWYVNGNIPIAPLGAASVIGPEGEKMLGTSFMKVDVDTVHRASYEPEARVQMLDALGIYAQIVYPNIAGFGNQNFLKVPDADLRLACVEIYNDAAVEMQERSGQRLFPMALVPWWDIDASVREIRRAKQLGLKGVVTCSNPQDAGMPDLGTDAWNPFWEVCIEEDLPINFHIGSSQSIMDWFGKVPWPSMNGEQKLSVGSANIFLGNAQVIGNLIFTGVPERYPELKFVSVESGVGWIPFFLEALDYQMYETAPSIRNRLTMLPSEYFRRQFYGCFWFESVALTHMLDVLGVNNVMFETDFPHPTCLYPRSDERVRKSLESLDAHQRRRVLQDNAAELYKIKLPSS